MKQDLFSLNNFDILCCHRRNRHFFILTITVFIISYCSQEVENARYRFEKANSRHSFWDFFVRNDPVQVRKDPVTRSNLFSWLNLKNYVRFRLWTRKNPERAHELKVFNEESVHSSNFDGRRLTKIIIHGYADSANEVYISEYLIELRDAYLKLGDVNLIIVDYTFFAMPVLYLTSLHEVAAERLTELLKFLVENTNLSLKSVHLIGMSWGAQIAGLCGHELKGQIGRITGLDPAGPLFRFVDNEFRLDKSDAQFVDIIHSNGGNRILLGGHFGLINALGHVDVYPNGGERQIGCPIGRTFHYETLICSHARVVGYYLESISSPLAFPMCACHDFEAFVKNECPCEDFSYMGEHISHKTRGIFQLITRNKFPYGHGPNMEVILPDLNGNNEIWDGNRKAISKRQSQQIENETNAESTAGVGMAEIRYKNESRQIKFDNEFSSSKYPNDHILQLCLSVMEEHPSSYLNNRNNNVSTKTPQSA